MEFIRKKGQYYVFSFSKMSATVYLTEREFQSFSDKVARFGNLIPHTFLNSTVVIPVLYLDGLVKEGAIVFVDDGEEVKPENVDLSIYNSSNDEKNIVFDNTIVYLSPPENCHTRGFEIDFLSTRDPLFLVDLIHVLPTQVVFEKQLREKGVI